MAGGDALAALAASSRFSSSWQTARMATLELARVLGHVGALHRAQVRGVLQGAGARHRLGEQPVVGVLVEPALVVGLHRRLRVPHIDDHAEVLGKPHLRVEALEAAEHLQAAGGHVVGLGRREMEVGLAQPGLGQHGQPRRAVDQDHVEHAAHMVEQRADAGAQARVQALLGDLALEQGELHVAGDQVDGARLVHVRDAADHEARPVHRHVVEDARHQQVDDGQTVRLQPVQVGRRQQHGADAGLRVRIDDQHVLAEHGRQRLGHREHQRGFAHAALGVHHGYGVTHAPH